MIWSRKQLRGWRTANHGGSLTTSWSYIVPRSQDFPAYSFTCVFNLIRWNSWVSQSSIWLQGSEGFILWSSAASFSCSVGRVEAVQCSLYCERHCCLEVCGAVACENDLVTWYLIAWSCGCLSLDPSSDPTQRAAEGTLKHSQPHCYVSLGWVGVGGGCVCVLVSIIQSGGKKHDNFFFFKKEKNLNENTRCQQIRHTNLCLLTATPAGYKLTLCKLMLGANVLEITLSLW